MRNSIQIQLPLLLLLVGTLAIASLYHYILKLEIESHRAETARGLNAAGTRLAGISDYLLKQQNDDALHMEFSLLAQYPDLTLAVVADNDNRVLHASQPAWHHRSLPESPLGVGQSLFQEARDSMSGRWAEFEDGHLMIGVYAFQMPLNKDDLSSTGTGIVVLGVDQSSGLLTAKQEAQNIAKVAASVLFLLTLILWYLLYLLLAQPVQSLVETTRAFAAGNYDASANIDGGNELGELSSALDSLADTARDREQVMARSLQLAKIVEESVNEIYVADANSFQIIDANRAARENLQYSEDEIRTLYPWNFVPEISHEKIKQMTAPLVNGSTDSVSIETIHKRKNGTSYPVLTRLQYLANQKPPVFSAFTQDITELQNRQAELKLRDRAMAEVDVGVLITDAGKEDNPIVYANAAMEQITGYSSDELLGRNARILRGDDHDQPNIEKIKHAIETEKPVQVLLRNYRKDGTQFMDELTISPVRNADDVVTHFIGIQRDVTQRLATDARLLQAQKIDAIGQLSGGIAHDFNNLLNVIIGNLEFLRMELNDPELSDYANEAESAAKMGARLTKRLLTFARQGALEPTNVNINDQLLAAMELLRTTIGETITLSTNLSNDLWTTQADPSEVENMVVNLVINARDAMPKGGRIQIDTANVQLDGDTIFEGTELLPGDYVTLTVSDNGIGMPDEVKTRVFEPFFTTKPEGKGTGLGLASIYGFAQQTGGHITVESETGIGTTFNVFLPRSKDSVSAKPAKEKMFLEKGECNGRVLVVEDNDLVRNLTARRLHTLNFDTLSANDGLSALAILETNTDINLVLSDVALDGDMSGYDVAHWVQSKRPECRLVLTAVSSDHLAGNTRTELTHLPLLHKPFNLQELEQAVTQALA